MEQQIINVAKDEIRKKNWAVTKQYLKANSLIKEKKEYKIERIEYNKKDSICTLYFPIKNEQYFFGINVSYENKPEICGIFIESGHRCYLTATSEELSFEQLSTFVNLKPLSGWSKGEKRKQGNSDYNFSRISYEPYKSLAYDLEVLTKLLLFELEKDSNGVNLLSEKSYAWISCVRYQYISSNAGFGLEKDTIKRMAALNLSYDVDVYISGRSIR